MHAHPTATPRPPSYTPLRRGVRAGLSLVPGIGPLGVALGVALGDLSVDGTIAWLSAPLLTAGSSQLVLMGQLHHGAGPMAAAALAVLTNSRFVLYGAALADRFTGQPAWFRWLAPHFVVDQTYGLASSRLAADEPPAVFRSFFAVSGFLLWVIWSVSVGVGLLAGPILPAQLPLEFVLPAMFLGLIVPGLRTGREALAVVFGGALTLVGAGPLAVVAGALAFAAASSARPAAARS
ncbi:MAG: AzlC family ABC transporter permease [Microbacteriaceae bacterium]